MTFSHFDAAGNHCQHRKWSVEEGEIVKERQRIPLPLSSSAEKAEAAAEETTAEPEACHVPQCTNSPGQGRVQRN